MIYEKFNSGRLRVALWNDFNKVVTVIHEIEHLLVFIKKAAEGIQILIPNTEFVKGNLWIIPAFYIKFQLISKDLFLLL